MRWNLLWSRNNIYFLLFRTVKGDQEVAIAKGEIKPKADRRARRTIDSPKKRTNYLTTLHGKKKAKAIFSFFVWI